MMKTQRSPLKRGLQILQILKDANGPLSLEQVAGTLGVNKSTAFRLLETLEDQHLVSRPQASGGYFLGHACLGLAAGFRRNMPLTEVATPVMNRLCDRTGESVGLYVVRGSNRICIASVDSRQPVRRTLELGQIMPLDRGAVSKAVLAFLPAQTVEDILTHFPDPLTRAKGTVSKAKFVKEIDEARKQGYAISIEETNTDIWGIGVPVLSNDGEVLAALVVSGPKSRLPKKNLKEIVSLAKQAEQEIVSKF